MAATGLGEDAFWDSTPRQTHRAIKAAEARRKRDEVDRRWHTWHVAALPLQKKFPPLKAFIEVGQPQRKKAKRPQTVEEMIAIAHAWSARGDSGRSNP